SVRQLQQSRRCSNCSPNVDEQPQEPPAAYSHPPPAMPTINHADSTVTYRSSDTVIAASRPSTPTEQSLVPYTVDERGVDESSNRSTSSPEPMQPLQPMKSLQQMQLQLLQPHPYGRLTEICDPSAIVGRSPAVPQ
ncbi:hypothetical protein PFISCL1PPCAC_21337, partial [Pristionchus fissidentatus]